MRATTRHPRLSALVVVLLYLAATAIAPPMERLLGLMQ